MFSGAEIGGQDDSSDLVNQGEFWTSVEDLIIDSSAKTKLQPTYNFWAPYIGHACRSPEVYNTEYCKGKKSKATVATEETADEESCLNEDFLLELMSEKKVCVSTIKYVKLMIFAMLQVKFYEQ